MDFDKMKVADLRTELSDRGLDTKGTKPVLVARLREHMEQQGEDVSLSTSNMEVDEEGSQEEGGEAKAASEEAAPVVEPATEKSVEKTADKAQEVTNGNHTEDKSEAEKKEVEAEKKEGEAEKKDASDEPLGKGVKRKRYEEEPLTITEDEPEIDEALVCLDWHNSDLSLKIDKTNLMTAEPLFKEGWGHAWSGARATHGFKSGKLYFEVKLLENLEAKLCEGEKNVHDLRVGWSKDNSSLMLGESQHSFAVTASAKKATNSVFEDFGVELVKDDVIGCLLNLESDPVTFEFTKNGESQGKAFEVAKSELKGIILFPHVSSKNIKFEVNFGKTNAGESKEAWFAPSEGFEFVGNAADPTRGTPRIATREECEMIMLVGLPGSGKTTWTNKFIEEHKDKRYNVIGVSTLLDQMKVNGNHVKDHCTNWQTVSQKATRCLNDWLRAAATRRRNYIIDQTNVFAGVQRRRIRPFQGMIRKAVVIVPSDEDYKARIESQDKAEAKLIPDTGIMEMKANFALPSEPQEEGEKPLYNEIIFAELNKEEATKLVEEYNKDAKEKGYGKRFEQNRKKMRGNNTKRGTPQTRGNNRGGAPFGKFQRGGGGMPPRGFMFRGHMGGPMRGMPMRGGMMRGGSMRGGPMRGGPMRGGPMRGGPMRGGPPFGGPRGGPQGGPRMGPYGNSHGGPRDVSAGGPRNGPRMNQNRGSGGGNFNSRFQGNKFGGGGGGGMPYQNQGMGNQGMGNQWGQSPWQPQQQQQQPQQSGWGNPWNNMGGGASNAAPPPAGVWNQGPMQSGYSNNSWGAGNGSTYSSQRYNTGNQNWGGYNR